VKKFFKRIINVFNSIFLLEKSFDERPWGYWKLFSHGEISGEHSNYYKIKKIVVAPGMRLSLQRHSHRSEHWFIISGVGKMTLNESSFNIEVGSSVDIEVGDIHRVENISNISDLIIIEIQTGTECNELDIVRISDDWGRE
jgi:mannose-6-phosphate isomerase